MLSAWTGLRKATTSSSLFKALPGAWKVYEGFTRCAGVSSRVQSKVDDEEEEEDMATRIRSLPEFSKLRPVLEVYTDKQLKEIDKFDFLHSFDLKYKGLAALFWNKIHSESSKIVNIVVEDGRPETFKLTSSDELKEILDGNMASGLKAIDDPHGWVVRNLRDLEPGKTYKLVWGLVSQAKALGIGIIEPEAPRVSGE